MDKETDSIQFSVSLLPEFFVLYQKKRDSLLREIRSF